MNSLSIVVPAHDVAAHIGATLASVDAAIAHFRSAAPGRESVRAEVVVVDDVSADATPDIVAAWARGGPDRRLIRRGHRGNAGAARNDGVAASVGDVVFFLDGDDLFLENHLTACWDALLDPAVQFVKTGVRLAHPVHPDWAPRIRNSLVINLAIRRACHDRVGGFFDHHLFRRRGHAFTHQADLFAGIEDVYYNRLVAEQYRGKYTVRETVEYLRHPGNSYDRQYAKFQAPPGQFPETLPAEFRLRVELCEVLFKYTSERLKHEMRQEAGGEPPVASRSSIV